MRLPAIALIASAAVVSLGACETRSTPEPCPGTVQGTLRLRGTIVDGAACAAAGGAASAIDVTASVSFVGDSGAALCLQRSLAEPLVGTRSGDTIDVSAPARAGKSSGCACGVDVVERVTGSLVRNGDTATGFSGELQDAFAPADGTTTCAPSDATATCDVPCSVRWTLATD